MAAQDIQKPFTHYSLQKGNVIIGIEPLDMTHTKHLTVLAIIFS